MASARVAHVFDRWRRHVRRSRRRHRLLDFNRAVGEHSSQRANRRSNRRDHRADHADRQRELGDDTALLFDDDTPDVALIQQMFDLRQDLVGRAFNLLAPGTFHRWSPFRWPLTYLTMAALHSSGYRLCHRLGWYLSYTARS